MQDSNQAAHLCGYGSIAAGCAQGRLRSAYVFTQADLRLPCSLCECTFISDVVLALSGKIDKKETILPTKPLCSIDML